MANTTIPSELIQASVALGGSPTTTTQSASDNTTKIATTAYVTAAVNALIDSAPGTMNTLNEIAAALNDDAAFNTTVTNAIATKLPLAGGTMTGNITLGDNNKAIFGAGSDLQIYHNGSNSYIVDGNSGSDLLIQSNNIVLENTSGHNMIHMASGGAVQLYHNNVSKVKTTATGAQIGLNNSTITRLQLYGATNAEHQIKFGNDGTNGEKDGAIRYFGEAHGTTANRRSMTFSTAQTERMRIDSSGNVGIGETSPDKQLHIKNTATGDTGIVIENTNNAQNLDIDFYNNAGAAQGRIRYAEGAGSFGFAPNVSATDALHILNDGKVGIGTSSPAKPLHLDVASGWATMRLEGASDSGGELEFYATSTKKGSIWFGNDAAFNIRVNGSDDAMTIKNSGNILTPKQAFFMTNRSAGNQTFANAAWVDVDWTGEPYDTGGNYTLSSGVFTAPIAGVYLFTGLIGFNTITASNYLLARLVCSSFGDFYITHEQKRDGGGDYGYDAAISTMVSLAASETVKIQVFAGGGGDHTLMSRSNWQGRLLG